LPERNVPSGSLLKKQLAGTRRDISKKIEVGYEERKIPHVYMTVFLKKVPQGRELDAN